MGAGAADAGGFHGGTGRGTEPGGGAGVCVAGVAVHPASIGEFASGDGRTWQPHFGLPLPCVTNRKWGQARRASPPCTEAKADQNRGYVNENAWLRQAFFTTSPQTNTVFTFVCSVTPRRMNRSRKWKWRSGS